MKLSIVIVNYNVAYFLEHCLYSVRDACKNIDSEIFVVDNNSVDDSLKMLREKFPEVILIENKENVGFSKANNQAMRIAKGEYILLLNPDTVVEEDTFEKCIEFIDSTPDCGGLGVKMIDGSGKLLPESKRGFPTPWVSFCKMSGLTKFFPNSKRFAGYYMGHLSYDEVNPVDVLAGAFMLMRKECLDKVGLLDEDYFMYGEDIDLSYRITKGGYKNYYFPKARIIHYKGESTKKGSLNYVYTFYNAMEIFAKKHLSSKQNAIFSIIIKLAIWFRASLSFFTRLFKGLYLPVIDFLCVYIGYILLEKWWSVNIWNDANYYPKEYIFAVVPIYVLIWLLSVYFSGGYSKPVRIQKIVSGVFFGMVTILVFYSLLPEELRYSRALVLLGAVLSLFIIILIRYIANFISTGKWSLKQNFGRRYVIIGKDEETIRVADLLRSTDIKAEFIGLVESSKSETQNPNIIGSTDNIEEIIRIYQINEVIFCAKDLSQQSIISYMALLQKSNLSFTIAPPSSDFIIGSNTINTPSDLYVVSINSIANEDNRRNKRLFDFLSSILILIFSPILMPFLKRPFGIWKNAFMVFIGKLSWVGYSSSNLNDKALPKIRKGVLNTKDAINISKIDEKTLNKLDLLYARNYSIQTDLNIIFKALRHIGK